MPIWAFQSPNPSSPADFTSQNPTSGAIAVKKKKTSHLGTCLRCWGIPGDVWVKGLLHHLTGIDHMGVPQGHFLANLV